MGQTIISQPEVTIAIANASVTVANTAQRVLIIGQMISGTAVAGELQENISSSGAPENALFGEASQIAAMIRAFKSVNGLVKIDAIGIADNGSATPRDVDFAISGTADAAGVLTVVAGSETLHKFEVAIPDTTTETAAGALVTAAVNADTKCPFLASDLAGAVTLQARNGGVVANDLGVEVINEASGLTVGTVTNTTAGLLDPVDATLDAALANATERYQGIVWPWRDTSPLESFLGARFNATNQVLDGVGFLSIVDDHANSLTFGDALNDQNVTVFADKLETLSTYKGPAMNEPSYAKSATFVGIRSLRLTEDASISRFLTTSASSDQFGGPALASLPYFNTPFPSFPLIRVGFGWTSNEIGQLFDSGVSVVGNNISGTSALVGEVVTTYKTDAASNPDPTFQFLNYVDTSSQGREYMFNNLRARFAQSRLTAGAVTRGRDMANALTVRAYVERLYQDLAGPKFVCFQDGEDAIQFFKDNLTIELDLASGKVTITMLVPLVTQLRTIIATMKIAFSTTA